ncbi:MAG: hypothetical protein WC860_05110 [Candidatus Margulisiibacteriota bacterium]|jgi:flagellar motor switch protein FliG
MVLSGKEKVLVLLKFLGPYSQDFLKHLRPEKAEKLMVNIENTPVIENDLANSVFEEIINKTNALLREKVEEVQETIPKAQQVLVEAEIQEEEEIENQEPIIATRDLSEVVDLLINEKPQIIAFFLSRLNENERENISNYIPENISQKIKGLEVEKVPLADKIFESLYKKIFQNLN